MAKIEHEWISVSDLMAGVVAVVVLLFMLTAIEKAVAAVKSAADLEASEKARRQLAAAAAEARVDKTKKDFQRMADDLRSAGLQSYVNIDVDQQLATLKDATFASADACLQERGRTAIETIRDRSRAILVRHPSARIQVEGHSDSVPVAGRTVGKCGWFDDNLILSTLRARDARRVLTEGWPQDLQRRTSVTGHGDFIPLPNTKPNDERNRRVEIRFILDSDSEAPFPDPADAGL